MPDGYARRAARVKKADAAELPKKPDVPGHLQVGVESGSPITEMRAELPEDLETESRHC